MKKSSAISKFPISRGRRLRHSSWIRSLTSETELSVNDLVQPLFVREDKASSSNIIGMPGLKRLSYEELKREVSSIVKLGIKAIAIFPVIHESSKSNSAEEALNQDNLVCRCLKFLRKEHPNLGVICDIALDPFTLSGHDGVLDSNGNVDNDRTIKILAKMALNFSEAGCEIIAPSDMMDGRIKIIRESLEKNKYINVSIISYSAKFCSEFYGPFRNAVGSEKDNAISKKSYQLNFKNRNAAIKAALVDMKEGADILMVKPAGYYLDIVRDLREISPLPIAAYQVSGEYSMLKNAKKNKILDYKKAVLESLYCIKRAGANLIFSYFSKEVAEWLSKINK